MPVPSEACVVLTMPILDSAISLPSELKHRDTRDSISSTDSDVSLTYDSDPVAPLSDSENSKSSDSDTCKLSDSENSKDSGCEELPTVTDSEDDFTPPDEELAARIVQQVEFYFSDVNITKDAFLLKHVKRNKEGYVSLKLISSFKRVKHLAKDWRVVAFAIANGSQLLQVNEARTKLRRIAPLPRYDDTAPSRTVVAFELPLEKPTIESVVDLFAPCGKLALVRILRPGNPVPADVRPFVAALPELAKAVCALVEFEDLDGAKCSLRKRPACAQAAPLQWGTMRVVELVQKSANTAVNTTTVTTKERKKRAPKPKVSVVKNDYDSSCTSDAESFYDGPRRRSSTGSSVCSSRSSPLNSPLKILQQSPLAEFVNVAPWVPRRPLPPAPFLGARPRSNTAPNNLRTIPENVLRYPRGPDGTKGFRNRYKVETRARSASAPMCPGLLAF